MSSLANWTQIRDWIWDIIHDRLSNGDRVSLHDLSSYVFQAYGNPSVDLKPILTNLLAEKTENEEMDSQKVGEHTVFWMNARGPGEDRNREADMLHGNAKIEAKNTSIDEADEADEIIVAHCAPQLRLQYLSSGSQPQAPTPNSVAGDTSPDQAPMRSTAEGLEHDLATATDDIERGLDVFLKSCRRLRVAQKELDAEATKIMDRSSRIQKEQKKMKSTSSRCQDCIKRLQKILDNGLRDGSSD